MNFTVAQALVKKILHNANAYDWTVQGLGMLRCYVGTVARIHIWDDRLEFPGVSKLHNHSWDLASTIMAGLLTNTRFEPVLLASGDVPVDCEQWNKARLVCGTDGGMKPQEPQRIWLRRLPSEIYKPGCSYAQLAEEVHLTEARRGTVTLMEREHDGPLGEADVFWPVGTEWGDAKPRPASKLEILMATSYALEQWDA